MKKLILPSVLIATFIIFSGFSPSKKIRNDRFEITFSKNTGFVELVMIKAYCEKSGIILTYKKIEYNDKGELTSLSFKVDCRDGFSGAAWTDHLTQDPKFGFFRDYRKDASLPFGTGNF